MLRVIQIYLLKVFLSKTKAKFLTIELQYFPKGWISAIENRDFAMVFILQLGKYLKGKTENE